MNCINLTDITPSIENEYFDFLSRVDNIYIASKINSKEQIEFIKTLDVDLAIDLKEKHETLFRDQKAFEETGIPYVNMPVSNVEKIDFEFLSEFQKLIANHDKKILVYCASGNRVGALLALYFAFICGHPKARAFEVGKKAGMHRENTQTLIWEKLNNY